MFSRRERQEDGSLKPEVASNGSRIRLSRASHDQFCCPLPSAVLLRKVSNAKQSSPTVASNITLNQLPTLRRDQKVNVTGILTLGQTPAKEVKKRNSDCVIEDATGNAILHIWDDLIDKVQNSISYTFKNLSVKSYSGNTMLGTTACTTFDEVQTELKQVKGPDLLENKEKKVIVQEFKFVDKLNIYFQCQIKACNKKMPYDINANIIKCPSCGATQKTKASKKAMSARLCANVDGRETWFTAFTDVLKSLIDNKQESNLTSDQISEALLSAENVTIVSVTILEH